MLAGGSRVMLEKAGAYMYDQHHGMNDQEQARRQRDPSLASIFQKQGSKNLSKNRGTQNVGGVLMTVDYATRIAGTSR